MFQYFVFVGAAVQSVGLIAYIKDMLRGKAKPNRVTWLMWSTAPLIAGLAALSDGAGWAALPTIVSGSGALLVFFVSFIKKQAYWKLKTFDYLFGLCSGLALILWYLTKEPLTAIIFSILSDLCATSPTIIKIWRRPGTETTLAYTTGLFNALTSFFAISFWSFSTVIFPIYWVITNCCIIFILYRKKIKLINN